MSENKVSFKEAFQNKENFKKFMSAKTSPVVSWSIVGAEAAVALIALIVIIAVC